MSATISQLSCFTPTNRNLRLPRRSAMGIALLSKLSVVVSLEGYNAGTSSLGNKANLSYTADLSRPRADGIAKLYSTTEKHVDQNIGVNGPLMQGVSEQKRAAKIHDFCFGIPFGGIVLTGGVLGYIFSRNLTTLSTGVLFGGSLLALSTISLKIWSQGKSSLPFILGQAVLSVALFWKNFQIYSSTRALFPSGLYAAISASMLCFYSYVLISGGNPPPKKLKLTPTANAAL
ncbi:hypothetical protein Nepgr_016660 [Nepenthes gracilis]|uniref:Protein FATTY ACID EXPORT 1, chloroplastic n=1 Tax=Nepenthes gracilis TaxID=150966 RepID=A0AAD3XSB7_NEPGR|nr:hypothetical protein Nepgr_016660 [Nepenthes gracilis]